MERLQGLLATRASTLHFAHAGISLMLATIFAGAAIKVAWDTLKYRWVGAVVGILPLALLIYAAARYFRGRRTLRQELLNFDSLKSVRRFLKLDDPSTLLPR